MGNSPNPCKQGPNCSLQINHTRVPFKSPQQQFEGKNITMSVIIHYLMRIAHKMSNPSEPSSSLTSCHDYPLSSLAPWQWVQRSVFNNSPKTLNKLIYENHMQILSCFSHISRSKGKTQPWCWLKIKETIFVKTEALQVPWHCIMCDISKRPLVYKTLDWFARNWIHWKCAFNWNNSEKWLTGNMSSDWKESC